MTANEWGIGFRCPNPRPPHIWRIMRPEEEEEPNGLLKWYIRGLKAHDDPSALVGLPLIRTCRMIRAAGVKVL